MEVKEDIVIVGGGISGLATALALHRVGIRSLLLEASESLRTTGFAFATWSNAWKALDALGIADSLRQQYQRLSGTGEHEARCLVRKALLETLSKELPSGTIRYSSKLVFIEESGYFKLLHLADGTIFRTKVLIGCDGVNSVVAKWLGFKKPAFTGRHAIRGCASISHGFEPKFLQFFGDGVRSGFLPYDANSVYWFFTWSPNSDQEKEIEKSPAEMRQVVLSKLGKIPSEVQAVIEKTALDSIFSSPLICRNPWELILSGNISKGNVCVAGDALHPTTPDLGQGACSALEDSVVLARCLAEALLEKPSRKTKEKGEEEDEYERIEMGLNKYGKERKWRSFELITLSYIVGAIQQSKGKLLNFLRDDCLAHFLASLFLKVGDFDCGTLIRS
ncbi:hypothetical protein UlMin_030981 [Ulmus minor]